VRTYVAQIQIGDWSKCASHVTSLTIEQTARRR
jgi:hypothetical protein